MHQEAQNEEMENRVQRDQYDRRMQAGGGSSNTSGDARPPISSRASQDGRQQQQQQTQTQTHGGVQKDPNDKRAQAAAIASSITSTAGKKDMSLKNVHNC